MDVVHRLGRLCGASHRLHGVLPVGLLRGEGLPGRGGGRRVGGRDEPARGPVKRRVSENRGSGRAVGVQVVTRKLDCR